MSLTGPFQKKVEFQPYRKLPSTDEKVQSCNPGLPGVRGSVLSSCFLTLDGDGEPLASGRP
jgi:hypothetical protein